jgi:Reverse transcriptase (RNA-dependent DNA polymerase)
MTLPPGHKNTSDSSLVCKLRNAIYGLKQSLRAWYSKLNSFLIKNNFVKSTADYSMFINHSDKSTTVILVYVDDTIITENDNEEIKKVKQSLKMSLISRILVHSHIFLE